MCIKYFVVSIYISLYFSLLLQTWPTWSSSLHCQWNLRMSKHKRNKRNIFTKSSHKCWNTSVYIEHSVSSISLIVTNRIKEFFKENSDVPREILVGNIDGAWGVARSAEFRDRWKKCAGKAKSSGLLISYKARQMDSCLRAGRKFDRRKSSLEPALLVRGRDFSSVKNR